MFNLYLKLYVYLLFGFFLQWTPSNVSVPLLNLVDKIFQLKRRGWLRWAIFMSYFKNFEHSYYY